AELTRAIEQQAEKCAEAQRLMTHPGAGALTAIAFVLSLGKVAHFICGQQRDSLLRCLLVEAAEVTVRSDTRWRNRFFHLAQRRGRKIAKVAMARKLAVRLYWMWRRGWNYAQLESFGSHVGQPGNRHGVQ